MVGVVSCVLLTACFTRRQIVNPEAPIPAGVSESRVKDAVRQALTDYGWTIDKEELGSTFAHRLQKQLRASIRVDYNQTHATVRYVDSENFLYSKSPTGTETIHSRYGVWARNIAERIGKILNPPADVASK
jgi:hypothetical protein